MTSTKKISDIPNPPQYYMQMAIEEMHRTKLEARDDGKVLPRVGAVLVFPDGRIVKAHRGELRNGDHAEFTLIERKMLNESLEDCVLYTTLEPCASRNDPKIPCCKRVVNARIKTVYIGIGDPDPTVDGKGKRFMEEHKVQVRMFDREFQEEIEKANNEFIKQAQERREFELNESVKPELTELPVMVNPRDDFSLEAINVFLSRTGLDFLPFSDQFVQYFRSLNLYELDSRQNLYFPTANGVILFSKRVRDHLPQAALMVSIFRNSISVATNTFESCLVLQPAEIQNWLQQNLLQTYTNKAFDREVKYEFPLEILREAIINALVHRDYSVSGAKCQVEIDDEKIIVRSPGAPPTSVTIKEFNSFNVPSFSRNPLISFILNKMGYAEERGRGMQLFKSLLSVYDLPLPVYSQQGEFLVVTFFKSFNAFRVALSNGYSIELNEDELRGYSFIKSVGKVKRKSYEDHFGIPKKTAERQLASLVKAGLVIREGASTSTLYKLTDKAF